MKIAGRFSCGRPMAVPTRGTEARRETGVRIATPAAQARNDSGLYGGAPGTANGHVGLRPPRNDRGETETYENTEKFLIFCNRGRTSFLFMV